MKILLTGGTGTLGRAIIDKILTENHGNVKGVSEIRIFSRNEKDQTEMKRRYEGNLNCLLGDVRDYEAIFRATRDVDVVIHAAAIKHIDVAEVNPDEAIKTNIIGTQHVLKSAAALGVTKLINISTDKTCNPHSTYGATKLIAERLTSAMAAECKSDFMTCRFGNILGSSGSVFSLWKSLIHKGRSIPITHKEMTRFFIRIDSAAEFVLDVLSESKPGSIFVPKLNSFAMFQLASSLMGYSESVGFDEIGLRPGEKIHEDLVNESELEKALFTTDFISIMPEIPNGFTEKIEFSGENRVDTEIRMQGELKSDIVNDLSRDFERFQGKYAITNFEMKEMLSETPFN
jgi:UDP-N-acetylglucosamine 4,6-dehydratase